MNVKQYVGREVSFDSPESVKLRRTCFVFFFIVSPGCETKGKDGSGPLKAVNKHQKIKSDSLLHPSCDCFYVFLKSASVIKYCYSLPLTLYSHVLDRRAFSLSTIVNLGPFTVLQDSSLWKKYGTLNVLLTLQLAKLPFATIILV